MQQQHSKGQSESWTNPGSRERKQTPPAEREQQISSGKAWKMGDSGEAIFGNNLPQRTRVFILPTPINPSILPYSSLNSWNS